MYEMLHDAIAKINGINRNLKNKAQVSLKIHDTNGTVIDKLFE